MDKIDTTKLREFDEHVTKLSSDYEETWYLVKRIIAEMEEDIDFDNPQVFQELHDALNKLETMMEMLQSIKHMMHPQADEYDKTIQRHLSSLQHMAEYASGFKANFAVIKKEDVRRVPVDYTNTGAIKASLERKMGGLEVLKDE